MKDALTRCVCCGQLIMERTASDPRKCDVCGGYVCPLCLGKMNLHCVHSSTATNIIHACPSCSSQLQEHGDKPINPYPYIGGY